MGKDTDAVVDPNLRLKALDNLFVVDASVMPSLTAGPIHAAVLAIAETFARTMNAVGGWESVYEGRFGSFEARVAYLLTTQAKICPSGFKRPSNKHAVIRAEEVQMGGFVSDFIFASRQPLLAV